ncbi:MAG: TPM domain-containing protein [Paludibacter sp.]|nr:TPM domain-containing protein [Paludibacter sp.]
MKKLCILLFSLASFTSLFAFSPKDIPEPPQGSYVTNPDGILSESTVFQLNTMLDSLALTKGVLVLVVAVNTIEDNDVHTFAVNIGQNGIGKETKGVGKANSDNGLVVLFVLDRRKIDFATGYGLESTLTDALCKRIQTQEMLPYFKQGDYDAGMIAGISRAIEVINGDYIPTDEDLNGEKTDWKTLSINLLIGFFAVMLITFLLMRRTVHNVRTKTTLTTNLARVQTLKTNKSIVYLRIFMLIIIGAFILYIITKTGWYAILLPLMPVSNIPSIIYSRKKIKQFRTQPIKCSECNGLMHFLPESEEDKYLTVSQQFEEKLHAVDYDVFECDTCHNQTVYPYEQLNIYQPCPSCGTRAYHLISKKTTANPTYISTGNIKETYQCLYCKHQDEINKTLPRLTATPIFLGGTGGGSFSSGSGGFGGFSGGGSFGGGSFGGGGATSGW